MAQSNQDAAALEDALNQAQGAVDSLRDASGAALAASDFEAGDGGAESGAARIDLLGDVNLEVAIELGRTEMLVEDVLRLSSGSVVELDKLAGDPVDVYVNQRLIARGEVLVLNDNFCIRISEIVANLEEQAEAAAEQQAAASA